MVAKRAVVWQRVECGKASESRSAQVHAVQETENQFEASVQGWQSTGPRATRRALNVGEKARQGRGIVCIEAGVVHKRGAEHVSIVALLFLGRQTSIASCH